MDKSKIAFFVSVLSVASLHFFFSFLMAFAAGISPSGSIYGVISRILLFPLQEFATATKAGDESSVAMWLLWACLSLCWGFVICYCIRHFARRNF